MVYALVKILAGYALAVAAATAVLQAQLLTMFGGEPLGWRDLLAAYAIIGVFAGAGFLFAIQGYRRGWTKASTYAGGGLIAMMVGVAALLGLGTLQGLSQGYLLNDAQMVWSLLLNAAQLLAIGVGPGLAGGLAFWLVSRPAPAISGNT